MGRLKKNCMRIMRARKKHYEIIGKIKIVIFKILIFPINIIIFISFICFRKKSMLILDIQDTTDKFIEDMKKL